MLAYVGNTIWMCQPLRWPGIEDEVKGEQEMKVNRIKRKSCPENLIDNSTKLNSQGIIKTWYLL